MSREWNVMAITARSETRPNPTSTRPHQDIGNDSLQFLVTLRSEPSPRRTP